MQKCRAILTVTFDDPYWVGVYERRDGNRLTVCRTAFGAEPKDGEVYRYLLENWHLLRFSPPVEAPERQRAGKKNPKRLLREISRQMSASGIGTKAQQALQLQRAEGKGARERKSRGRREAEKDRQFERKREKRKQKHRGH